MDGAARTRFIKQFFPGLFFLTALYVFLTAYRAVRDDFAVEIWNAIGFTNKPSILATSEMWVGFGVWRPWLYLSAFAITEKRSSPSIC